MWFFCEFFCEFIVQVCLLSTPTFTNAQSHVYKTTEEGSGRMVALKKSRASKKLKRTLLRHESRVLQLLQGQDAIPALYGYGHLDHFEYMSMELLGPSIAEQLKEGAGVSEKTVGRIIGQAVHRIQIQLHT